MSIASRIKRRKHPLSMAVVASIVAIVGLSFLGFLIAASTPGFGGNANNKVKATKSSGTHQLAAGQIGRIDVGGGFCIICRDVQTYDKLMRLITAKDTAAMERIASSETAFAVQDGTKVKLLSPGLLRAEVSIQEGPYTGETGYIVPEFVVP